MDNDRDNILSYKRIVVKVGTTTLTYDNGKMNYKRIKNLAWVLSDLHNQGKEIILVSSGAIAVGTDRLGLAERPRDIIGKQATSAVGQAALMQIYENFFMEYNQKVAQILLTKDVLENKVRKTHARNTFSKLLSMGIIPIVNENDTIAVDELEFSDNDTLSAYVACLVESDGLIILSDIEGFYDSDPKINPNAKKISYIKKITKEIESAGGEAGSSLGTGGMATKISAAKMAVKNGIDMIIAQGNNPEILFDILERKDIGTFFQGKKKL